MKPRKPFLLRLDPALHAAIEQWAEQELRSVNGQIEWILRQAVRQRTGKEPEPPPLEQPQEPPPP